MPSCTQPSTVLAVQSSVSGCAVRPAPVRGQEQLGRVTRKYFMRHQVLERRARELQIDVEIHLPCVEAAARGVGDIAHGLQGHGEITVSKILAAVRALPSAISA